MKTTLSMCMSVAFVAGFLLPLHAQKPPLKALEIGAGETAATQAARNALQLSVPATAKTSAFSGLMLSSQDIERRVENGLAPFPTVTANKVLIQQYMDNKPAYMIPTENKHSISPQRQAFDGGKYPSFITRQMMDSFRKAKLESASEYITRNQRLQYAADLESLRLLYAKMEENTPANLDNLDILSVSLVHSVPPETMTYIKDLYRQLVLDSQNVHKEITTWLVYAALPLEGKRLSPQKNARFNQLILDIQAKIKELSQHLETPYLEDANAYWFYMFGTINPVLKGLLAPHFKEIRTDGRVCDEKQFLLHDLEGNSYLFPAEKFEYGGRTFTYPGSSTLVVDPDDMLEKSILEVRAEMNFISQLAQRCAPEREELLAQLPENQRIAYINDDANPRANFIYWHKQGYLGKGASLDVFSTGTDFMQTVRNGTKYDLVITDLLVENGGMYMMPELRNYLPKATVIANSKYELDVISPKSLFNVGMDGYMWNNTNFDQGMIGYMEYLRGMTNYYKMRAKYGWAR